MQYLLSSPFPCHNFTRFFFLSAALIINYKHAKSNLESLKKLGASLLHGVDATKMRFHADLKMRKFDRIIYNFPHAGFYGKEDEIHLVM